MSFSDRISLLLTVRLWIESPARQGPRGDRSPAHGADPGVVSLLRVPRLIAQITPAPHYLGTPAHRPPVLSAALAALDTVPVAGGRQSRPTEIRR